MPQPQPIDSIELEVGRTYWVSGLIDGKRRMWVKRRDELGRWHLRVLGPAPRGISTDYTRQPIRSTVVINTVPYEVAGHAFTGIKVQRAGGPRRRVGAPRE